MVRERGRPGNGVSFHVELILYPPPYGDTRRHANLILKKGVTPA